MRKIIGTFLALLVAPCLAGDQARSDNQNPLRTLRYLQAFDQGDISLKYKGLFEELGCAENVFGELEEGDRIVDISGSEIRAISLDTQLKDFREECLKRLNAERRYTLLEPALGYVQSMCWLAVALAGVSTIMGPDSFGGGFSVFVFFFEAVRYIQGISEAVRNWMRPPVFAVDALERQYAQNKCFIPNGMWGKIEDKFMDVRQNPYIAEGALNYLKFALGLTVFAPKKTPRFAESNVVERLKVFFKDYEKFDDPFDFGRIAVNIKAFIDKLKGKDKNPRPVLLYGPGGIGKTHFVNLIAEILQEMFPGSIGYEKMIVSAPGELEGDEEVPGAFLKILRNQCRYKQSGSVAFFDEANWLNDPKFEAVAKRTLDKPRDLSSRYLGEGIDGTGVSLPMPKTLTFLALNEDGLDKALKSRFSAVRFPWPTKEALGRYAQKLGGNELPEGVRTFRELEDIIPAMQFSPALD